VKLAFALLVALLACSGCAGGSENANGPYTGREMQWIRKLAQWEKDYSAEIASLDAAYRGFVSGERELADYRRALNPLLACGRGLRARLARPPSDRLRSVFRLLENACGAEERFARAESRRFDEPGATENSILKESLAKRESLFRRADRTLERGLLVNRRLPVAGGLTTKSRIEPRLTRAAQVLAPTIEIRCWSAEDWTPTLNEWEAFAGETADVLGFVSGQNRANLAPKQCADLARFTYRHWRPARGEALEDAADAVELLAHETEHVADRSGTEAETECRAVQDVRGLALSLGATPSYAGLLAVTYWQEVYPSMPREYRTGECRSGASLDMDPENAVWP
jgi:hypothetical protein